MVEVTECIGEDVLVKRPVAVGENIMMRGEDFAQGSVVVSGGTRLSARDIGALAAVGTTRIPVRKQPLVASSGRSDSSGTGWSNGAGSAMAAPVIAPQVAPL